MWLRQDSAIELFLKSHSYILDFFGPPFPHQKKKKFLLCEDVLKWLCYLWFFSRLDNTESSSILSGTGKLFP